MEAWSLFKIPKLFVSSWLIVWVDGISGHSWCLREMLETGDADSGPEV